MGLMVFGHRGAGHNEPENTLRAIRWALTHGIDGVEVDLRLTKDKRVILIHDESVDRTTDGTGFLRNLTLNEVKKLDGSYMTNPSFVARDLLEAAGWIIKDLKH